MAKENDKIEEALAKLQKKYGKDVVIQLDSAQNDFKVEAIPTGCYALDDGFGCGGLPRGRMIEIYGEQGSGKSTLALFLIAQIQKQKGKAALIDAEFAFDGEYAKSIGVDLGSLMVSQPDTLEEAMDVVRGLVETSQFDIIVIDSVAALTPKQEMEEGEMLKDTMAVQARLMSKALRILTSIISKSKTVVIFINQLRDKIGIFYGAKTTTPGGKALKFYSSVRIDVQKGSKIEEKEEQIGNWMSVTFTKNKVGVPFKKEVFELYYNRGIDLDGDLIDYAEKIGVIKKTGNTYTFGEVKLGVGRDTTKEGLKKNLELFNSIKKEVDEKLKVKK